MMKKLGFPRGMSLNIRSKFTISFLAMGLLPLFIFALISYNVYLKGLQKNVTTYSFEVIERIDKNLETYISDIENILKLRSDYYVQQYLKLYDAGDIDGNRKYTMRLWETFDYLKKMKTDLEDIRLISNKGRVISCYGTYWEDIGSNPMFIDLIARAPEKMHIQAPHLSMHNKRVFSIGKIVSDMDKQGIMCIDINVDILNTICNDIRLGEKGYVYLAQEDGNVIFLPGRADEEGIQNRAIRNPELLKSSQGTFIDTADDISYIVTYKTSAITSWKIIGVSPQSEMATAAMLSCIYGKGTVYIFNDINFENKLYSKQLYILVDTKLYEDLKVGAFEELKKDVVEIIARIKSSKLELDAVNTIINNIILMSCKTVNELGYNILDIMDNSFSLNFSIYEITDLIELEEWLFGFFYKINEYISKNRRSRNELLISRIKDYIDENYFDNVSLTAISKIFGISSGYLSSLFCEFNGLNFIDYLSNLRIQKAKVLLKNSDLRIYEIAEKIGYRDAYYFSSAFKKIVGINPTDYREKRKLFK